MATGEFFEQIIAITCCMEAECPRLFKGVSESEYDIDSSSKANN